MARNGQTRLYAELPFYAQDPVDKHLKIQVENKSLTFPRPAHVSGFSALAAVALASSGLDAITRFNSRKASFTAALVAERVRFCRIHNTGSIHTNLKCRYGYYLRNATSGQWQTTSPILPECLLPGAKQPRHHCGVKGKFGSIPERLLSSKAVVQPLRK
jgi:hypothetical protein